METQDDQLKAIKDAEKSITLVQQFLDTGIGDGPSHLKWAREAIETAASQGVEVGDLQNQVKEMVVDVFKKNAEEAIAQVQQFLDTGIGDGPSRLNGAREAIETAASQGVEVGDLQAKHDALAEQIQ